MKKLGKVLLALTLVFGLGASIFFKANVEADEVKDTQSDRQRHTDLRVDDQGELIIDRERVGEVPMGKEDSWTLLIYLCGSDLETNYNSATQDIKEMIAASQCANVNVVIQTGGSYRWNKPCINAEQIGRYVIKNNRMELVESLPDADMGSVKTFRSFLKWGVKKYPAEHMGVIMWNHGGGSITGICNDEKSYDSLSLAEVEKAFYDTSKIMTDRFEFVGMDACLMATVETANILVPYADYFIASQNTEPCSGWEYKSLVNELVTNPDISGEELAPKIVDAYMATMEEQGEEYGTLSAIDLSKLDKLLVEYNRIIKETKDYLSTDETYTEIWNVLNNAALKGGFNPYDSGIDMMNFISELPDSFETKESALWALEDAVLYNRTSSDKVIAGGLTALLPTRALSIAEFNKARNIVTTPYTMNFIEKFIAALVYQINDLKQQGYMNEEGEVIEGVDTSQYVMTPGMLENYVEYNWEDSEYYFEDNFDYMDYLFDNDEQYEEQKDNEYFFDKDFDDNWYMLLK